MNRTPSTRTLSTRTLSTRTPWARTSSARTPFALSAAFCLLAIAGCASDRGGDTPVAGSDNYGSVMPSPSPGGASTSGARAPLASAGVVQAIDQMQRQDVGIGALGAAVVGGSGMPTDKVYRITVRLDDGSTQWVVADSMPAYKVGDRVRYNNGSVQSY